VPLLDEPLPAEALWPEGFGSPLPIRSFAGPTLPPPLAQVIADGRPLCAHNAFDFDMHVWRAKGLPEPSMWLDTVPDARAAGLPAKLDVLGHRLLGRGKDDQGVALLQRLSRPDRRGLFLPLNRPNTARIARYNVADVLLLHQMYPVLRGHSELDVVAVDRVINERGIAFDRDLAEALITLESRAAAYAAAAVERLTAGVLRGDHLRSPAALLRWLRSQGADLPNLQQDTILRFLAGTPPPDSVVAQVLQARLVVSRITTAKLQRALEVMWPDGRLRDLLVYHKAHTGRWAARVVQPHNLPRPHPHLKDLQPLLEAAHDPARFTALLPPSVSLADALSALVRPCLRAGPGQRLLIADYASIEARGAAWCASEEHLLNRFRQGDDVYCDLASRLFGRRINPTDGLERGVGKQAILGCGYGMGADTFGRRCAEQGIDLAAAGTSAEEVVEGYRDAYPAIAGVRVADGGHSWRSGGLWKDVEAAAREAIQTGGPRLAGRCCFERDGATLVILLPSGRRLSYRNARIEEHVPAYCDSLGLAPFARPTIVYDDPRRCEHTYGGKLVENIVQAICRDLLAASLLECERQGLPVVLHVHDEIVVEVPAQEAEGTLRRFAVIMSTPPTWAVGFPVEVTAFAAERYLKSAPRGAPIIKARGGYVV
jgi:DNA polymerase